MPWRSSRPSSSGSRGGRHDAHRGRSGAIDAFDTPLAKALHLCETVGLTVDRLELPDALALLAQFDRADGDVEDVVLIADDVDDDAAAAAIFAMSLRTIMTDSDPTFLDKIRCRSDADPHAGAFVAISRTRCAAPEPHGHLASVLGERVGLSDVTNFELIP
jgi:hypothetical protein